VNTKEVAQELAVQIIEELGRRPWLKFDLRGWAYRWLACSEQNEEIPEVDVNFARLETAYLDAKIPIKQFWIRRRPRMKDPSIMP
jgi:hypothetical protein